MWILNNSQQRNMMAQLLDELMKECTFSAPGSRLSYTLRIRLERYKQPARRDIVSRIKDDCAPLFIACKRGQVEIVEYLITVCNADIEQRGMYEVPDDRSVHYVTPLWCAAVAGKLSVVKCLIAHGADVNAVSDTGSTPVRSACFMTHLGIVQYLVDHGADILRANYNGGTCLINSVQSVELCILLLKNGADINARDIQNKTVLHYAIQEHRFHTTSLFLAHSADPHLKSRNNDDALQTACLKGSMPIFDYLIQTIKYSKERLANAHELMGSTFFDEHGAITTALGYWRRAMRIRMDNMVDGKPLPKKPIMPKRECFGYAVEFSTMEEIDALIFDLDAAKVQSLLICERVLGENHKDTLYRLMYRGASYADALRYQNCIDLWRRTLEIRVENESILNTDTCFTARALVKVMVDLKEASDRNRDRDQPRFCDAVAIFKLLTSELSEARELLEIRPVYKRQQDCYDRILKCVTHLIYLLVETAQTKEQERDAYQLVHELVKKNPTSASTGDSLLHLCVSSLNSIKSSYFTSDARMIVFPHTEVVKLLLDCGAHVNARNEFHSTPLHIASNAYNFMNPLIKLLLDYGAHLDTPNRAGDTPENLISTNPHNNINLVNYLSLRCYAAQTIFKYGIDCTGIPVTLHEFLEYHRPHCVNL